MVVVTPVPEDPKEKASKRWHKRQELQGVLTLLSMIHGELDEKDDLEVVVAEKLTSAAVHIKESMELLSPTPQPRVRTKREVNPWDK